LHEIRLGLGWKAKGGNTDRKRGRGRERISPTGRARFFRVSPGVLTEDVFIFGYAI
jgi:hypothetical protein